MQDRRESAFLRRTRWIGSLRFLFFLIVLALSRKHFAEAPETFAHALARHHIELTKPALIEALRNPDKEVRGLAAWQLLEMKEDDSLPMILQAVRDERDSQTKINLASAAASMGSQEARAVLEGICHDASEPGWNRTEATRHLFDLHDRACLPDLWQMMGSGVEWSTRVSAMNLVQWLHDLDAAQSAQLLSFTLEALNDSEPSLRLFAADSLARMQDTAAIPNLRAAIEAEKLDAVKSAMEDSLRRLLAVKPSV